MEERMVITVTLLSGIFLGDDAVDPGLVSDQLLIPLLLVAVGLLAIVFGVAIFVWFGKFRRELRHLNMRINQAISKREKQHYMRCRRNLWGSIIPFVEYKGR